MYECHVVSGKEVHMYVYTKLWDQAPSEVLGT